MEYEDAIGLSKTLGQALNSELVKIKIDGKEINCRSIMLSDDQIRFLIEKITEVEI